MARYEQGIVVQHAPLGHESLLVGAAAIGLAALPPLDHVRRIVIRTVDQPINYTDDGVDPSSTAGMYLAAGDTLIFDATRADLLKFIRASSATGNADVRIAYYGL